jgi:hypothetical protein
MHFQVDITLKGHTRNSLMLLRVEVGDDGVGVMEERMTILDFWRAQPADQTLHVLVKLPTVGEQGFVVAVFK